MQGPVAMRNAHKLEEWQELEKGLTEVLRRNGVEEAEEKAKLIVKYLRGGTPFTISSRHEERVRAVQQYLESKGYTMPLFTLERDGETIYYLMSISEEERAIPETKEELRPPKIKRVPRTEKTKVVVEDKIDSIAERFFAWEGEKFDGEEYGAIVREGADFSQCRNEDCIKLLVASHPDIITQFALFENRMEIGMRTKIKGCGTTIAGGCTYKDAKKGINAFVDKYVKTEKDVAKRVLMVVDAYGYYLSTNRPNGSREDFFNLLGRNYLYFLNEENYNSFWSNFPPTWRVMVENTARKLAKEHARLCNCNIDEETFFKHYRAAVAAIMVTESASNPTGFIERYGFKKGKALYLKNNEREQMSLSALRKNYGKNPTIFTAEIVKERKNGDVVARVVHRAYVLKEEGIEVYEYRDGKYEKVGTSPVSKVETTLSDGTAFTIERIEEEGKVWYKANANPFIYLGGVEIEGGRITKVTHLNKVSYMWQNIQDNDGKTTKLFLNISDIGLFQNTVKYGGFRDIEVPSGGFVPPEMIERPKEGYVLWGQLRTAYVGKPFKENRVYILPSKSSAMDGEAVKENIKTVRGFVVGRGQSGLLYIVGDSRVKKDDKGYYVEGGGRRYYLEEGANHIFALRKVEEENNVTLYNAYILLDEEGKIADATLLEKVNPEDLEHYEGKEISIEGKTYSLKQVGALHIGKEDGEFARGNDGLSILLAENFGRKDLLGEYISTPLGVNMDPEEKLPYVSFKPIGNVKLYNEKGWDYQVWAEMESKSGLKAYGEGEYVVFKKKEQTPKPSPQPSPKKRPEEKPQTLPRLQTVEEGSMLQAKTEPLTVDPEKAEKVQAIGNLFHLFYITEKVGDKAYLLDKEGRRVGIVDEGGNILFLTQGEGRGARLVSMKEYGITWEDVKKAVKEGKATIATEKGEVTINIVSWKNLQLVTTLDKSNVAWGFLYNSDNIAVRGDTYTYLTKIRALRGRTYEFHIMEADVDSMVVRKTDKGLEGRVSYNERAVVAVRAVKEEGIEEPTLQSGGEGENVQGVVYPLRYERLRDVTLGNPGEVVGASALAYYYEISGEMEKAKEEMRKMLSFVRVNIGGKEYSLYDLANLYKEEWDACSDSLQQCTHAEAMKRLADRLGVGVNELMDKAALLIIQTTCDGCSADELGSVLLGISGAAEKGSMVELIKVVNESEDYFSGNGAVGLRALIESTGTVEVVLPMGSQRYLKEFMFNVVDRESGREYFALSLGAYIEWIRNRWKAGEITIKINDAGQLEYNATESFVIHNIGEVGIASRAEYESDKWGGGIHVRLGIAGLLSEEVISGEEGLNVDMEKWGLVGEVDWNVHYLLAGGEGGPAFYISFGGAINYDNFGTLWTEEVTDEDGNTGKVIRVGNMGEIVLKPGAELVFSTAKITGKGVIWIRGGTTTYGGELGVVKVLPNGWVVDVTGGATVSEGINPYLGFSLKDRGRSLSLSIGRQETATGETWNIRVGGKITIGE